MGGIFQETITITDTADGSGDGNATGIINIPFRAGYLSQVMIELTDGDATNFSFNIYEEDNAGTPYTTETNVHRVKAVADAARTEYEARQDHRFFLAEATAGSSNSTYGKGSLTVYIAYTGASATCSVTYTVKIGGIGVN
jgi:hypothetical protein